MGRHEEGVSPAFPCTSASRVRELPVEPEWGAACPRGRPVTRSVAYVGPSVPPNLRDEFPAVELLPPVQHGDLFRLGPEPGDRILIVDGLFHHYAAVRHKEILWALARGASLLGCSSMGALRAAELAGYGMKGVGSIYGKYRSGAVISDDYVALSHEQDWDARPVTVALASLESALEHVLDDREVIHMLMNGASRIFYAERTPSALGALGRRVGRSAGGALLEALNLLEDERDHYDAKVVDARIGLEMLGSSQTGDMGDIERNAHATVYSTRWENELNDAGSKHVSVRTVREYVQLFHPEFSRYWRAYARERYASLLSGPVYRNGVPVREYWCSQEELRRISGAECAELAAIRSLDVRAAWCLDESVWRAIVPDWRVWRARTEDAVAFEREFRTQLGVGALALVDDRLLQTLVADAWRIPVEDFSQLEFSARDRGFRSFAEAALACKSFVGWLMEGERVERTQ